MPQFNQLMRQMNKTNKQEHKEIHVPINTLSFHTHGHKQSLLKSCSGIWVVEGRRRTCTCDGTRKHASSLLSQTTLTSSSANCHPKFALQPQRHYVSFIVFRWFSFFKACLTHSSTNITQVTSPAVGLWEDTCVLLLYCGVLCFTYVSPNWAHDALQKLLPLMFSLVDHMNVCDFSHSECHS